MKMSDIDRIILVLNTKDDTITITIDGKSITISKGEWSRLIARPIIKG